MAEVSPAGHVLEKTTRTRIIPEAQSAQPIDYWEYIERQKLPDPDHLLYLYLQRDSRNIPYGTYTSHIGLRDGKLVPIDDREAFEAAVQSRFGGGIWRLILKCGKQRKCETRIFTGDGPTYPPPTDAQEMQNSQASTNGRGQFGAQTPTMDGSTQIANKAIDVLAGQEHQAVNLGLGMMTTAADVMKRFAERSMSADPLAAPPAPGPEADLRNALTQALVARLAADPLQQVAQTLALMREITNGNGGGGGGINRQLDEFRSVFSFARELLGGSMAPAANASTGAAIVNVLPGIVSAGVDIARAWQSGKEAERDSVAMATRQPGRPGPVTGANMAQRSPFDPPPRPGLPPQAPPPSIAQPMLQPNPSPPAVPPAGAIVPPSTEFIESRITEILRCPIPAEEAASRALEFLHTLSGENPAVSYVTQLVVLGETGLVNLFHMRPILKPATNDMARLLEFIRSFLKFNAEEEALRAKDHKPN